LIALTGSARWLCSAALTTKSPRSGLRSCRVDACLAFLQSLDVHEMASPTLATVCHSGDQARHLQMHVGAARAAEPDMCSDQVPEPCALGKDQHRDQAS